MAITNAQQYKQLVNKPANGKRPGYRGVGGYRGGPQGSGGGIGREQAGSKGSGFETGRNVGRDPNEKPAYEMIGGQKVNIGDTLGRQRALEKSNIFQRPKRFQGIRSLASKFNPLSLILGLISPALGIASRFVTQQAPDTFKTFKDSPTLADFLENMKTNKISNISVDSGRGSGLREPIVPIEPISESDMSIPMIERISESDMSLLTPEQQQLIQDQNVNEQVGDIRDIMAADGGMIGGGIMDAAGRQQYFLGKLVKKAKRAVKKIVKSPIGKIGLGAALAFTPLGGKTLASRFMGLSDPMKYLIGGAGLSALPFIFGNQEDDTQQLASMGSVGGQIDPRAYTNPRDVLFPAFRMAEGGRIGLKEGEGIMKMASAVGDETDEISKEMFGKPVKDLNPSELEELREYLDNLRTKFMAEGGSAKEPVAKKTMPLLDMGGQEMDLRAEGGFVPIGRMEKADDVPARLSKNEFVFTADAVRNAGDGDVDKGAEVMYNMMKNLEAGGDVSEESQGLEGARNMFQTSKRLEEVI